MNTIRKWIGFTLGMAAVVLLVVGFAPDSSNFNNTQFLVTGTTMSIAHLSANLVDSGALNIAQMPSLAANTVLGIGAGGGTPVALTMGANMSIVAGALTASASGDGGQLTHLNANSITGGVWRVDVPGFALIPDDSGSMAFVTNTPGTTQGGIQGGGPSRMMWQISTDHTNVYAVFPLPYNYDGGTITAELWFTGGTNWVTQTTNVVTAAASVFGTALGTAVTVTNRVAAVGVTTFWTTNTQLPAITIAGSPVAGRSVTVEFKVQNKSPAFSITNLLCAHHASIYGTSSATQRGSITQP